jgi:glycosyltransferase involved in cell wall biosynthesis
MEILEICIVNPGYSMGGAERINVELANSLSKNHNVSLIDFTGNNNFFYKVSPAINVSLKVPKINFKRKVIRKLLKIRHNITGKILHSVLMYKEQVNFLIKIFKENTFDIIIFSQGLLTSFIPYIKSELPNIKIVAWQHSSYEIYTDNYFKNILKDYINGLKQADCVVCLTKKDEEKFKKINNNSICIYNWLPIQDPIISDVRSKNILFVGRLVIETKGLDFIIDLAKSIENGYRILIAGDGNDRQKFEQMIKNNSLEDKIVLYGNLNSKQLREFYSQGSIFISTSRWEGFGLVLLEAMASGLPVISFNNVGPTELLLDGEFGYLINKYDLKDFSEKLNILTQDYKKRVFWKEKSLERVSIFKKETIMQKWEGEFEKLT